MTVAAAGTDVIQSYEKSIASLRRSLEAQADPKTKTWWEGYVKGGAPFLGVKMAVIRSTLYDWYGQQIDGHLDLDRQKELARALIQEKYTEEKLAGILLLQEILVPAGVVNCEGDIDRYAALFAGGSIHDWNVCDWFCIKVLGPLIAQAGEGCAEAVSEWRGAENLWQARASVVPFVTLADVSTWYPLVRGSCKALIRREERFAKTAVGWVLRDISKHDKVLVDGFVDENLTYFSLESLRNALKYFAKEERDQYVQELKDSG